MRADKMVHPFLVLAAAAAIAAHLVIAPPTTPSRAAVAPAGQSLRAGPQATASAAPTAAPTCVPAPNGMVAWWRFELREQEVGTPVPPAFYADLAGVQNDAVIKVAPQPIIGFVGNGLQFDGTTQFLEAADHPEIDFESTDFTIAAWVRLPSDATGVRTIVDKRSFSPVRGYALFTSGGKLSFQMGDGSVAGNACSSDPSRSPCTNFNSGKAINDNRWHFVAVSVSRNGNGIFYIDGQKVTFNAAPRWRNLDNAAPLRIGKHAQTGGLWKGWIDEVELFGRALAESDLAAIYRAGPVGQCPPAGAPICPTATPAVFPLLSELANVNSGVPVRPSLCQPQGARELVNIDAVNQCVGGIATGFRFTLSDFKDAVNGMDQYNGSSTDFSFTTYETPPPKTPTPGNPGNPFTTPEAVSNYQPDGIVLEWHNSKTGRVVGNATPGHFGYSLKVKANGSKYSYYKVRADWLLESSNAQPCSSALVEATSWEVTEGMPEVQVTLQNPATETRSVTTLAFVAQNPVVLGDLVSSNTSLWSMARLAGTGPINATLAPGEAVSVTLPIDITKWGVVVITDWHDGQTNVLRARSFRARPFTALVPPTAVVSPTSTPTSSPSHLPPSPAPLRSSTPSHTPTQLPFATPSLTRIAPPATPSPTPTEDLAVQVCPKLSSRVPAAVLVVAASNPEKISGWGLRCTPSKPASPVNGLRTWLTLWNPSIPYHPLFNSLVLKCGCQ